MEDKLSRRKRRGARGLAVAAIGGLGLSALGVVGAAPAAAVPVQQTINYHCVFPLIGNQPLTVDVTSDIPAEIPVGEMTPAFEITATAHITGAITNGLRAVRATTIEGTATADAVLSVPESPELPVAVDVVIPSHDIPQTPGAEWDLVATGAAPQLVFTQPGHGEIYVENMIQRIDPKRADGTSVWPGGQEVQCTKDPGQEDPFAEFEITDGTPTPTPT
ncbi:hypothetical protein E1281_24535, partial [Actinomadura sp. KC345]|uniref:DUF6801 domain-containing protein n=1 Tax=Actinomadura sp. KC345 TaxID=2530371 RepID=UPI00104790E6